LAEECGGKSWPFWKRIRSLAAIHGKLAVPLSNTENRRPYTTLQMRYCTFLLISALALGSLHAQTPSPRLQTFLRQQLQFSAQNIDDVGRGKAVARILPSEKQEVAVFGIVLVHAPADFFVDRFRDIESYKKGTSILQVKKFSDPPRMEDLRQLTIDKDDLRALRNCKVGDCAVKLPSNVILRVQKEIDWSSPDAEQKVTELGRSALLQYVERYLAGGNAQLSEYSDKKQPLRVAEQFEAILKASPYIFDYDPEFYEYLSDYPKKHLDGVEDFLYWSKEKFGLKPVISVTHVSIYRKPEFNVTLIASKQIYANHYFEASLGLTVALSSAQAPDPSFYLLYFNRSRSDALHGGFSGLARGQVKSRARSGALENLAKIQRSIEAQFAARPAN
jgi:hypothetical protein